VQARVRDLGRRALTLVLIGAFIAFMALIGAVHAVDAWSLRRYGYAPFAVVNVLLMVLPSLALLAGIARLFGAGQSGPDSGGADLETSSFLALTQSLDPLWLCSLTVAAGAAMAWLIGRRTNAWVALFTASMLSIAAPVLVFSVLFRALAGAGQAGD